VATRLPWPGGQLQGLVDAVVGHQRADRAEGLDLVHRALCQRVVAQQQRGREEGAMLAVPRAHRHGARPATDQSRALAQQRHALGHVGLLRMAGQRAHLHALDRRVAHHHLGQAGTQGLGHRVQLRARHDGAADGGALLAGLDRHLARHLLDEELELRVVGRRTSGARMAQFSESASALNGMLWRTMFGCTRSCRAVSALPVKVTTSWPSSRSSRSPVEPITSCSAPSGTRPDSHDQAHRRLGQVAGGGGRLGDAGHAGQEAGRKLLQQAPDREVEGVDVHRHAPRGTRMWVPAN
jgi:hypothetical protein